MNGHVSEIYPDGFRMGDTVWARRDHDGIYWPGKINFISNNFSERGLSNSRVRDYQTCSYFIQFFGSNQTHWTVDVLPYRQYREYISKNLLFYYESYPQIKYQFFNAMNQADYADNNEKSNASSMKTNPPEHYTPTENSLVTNKDLLSRNSTSIASSAYPFNHYPQPSNTNHPSYRFNGSHDTQLSVHNNCSCCIQPSFSSSNPLSIETNPNSFSQFNDDYQSLPKETTSSPNMTFEKSNAIIIITTKTYSNSSFISYLYNCFSHFIHHSIIYIDDSVNNNQHPITPNISYLICLDQFDSNIKQILNTTVLNHLTIHINYLYLILIAPSHELVKYFYSTAIDQRTIVVLHYHSTLDNEPLLLCSGNRATYEMIRSTLLKYLCPKMKYIEADDEERSHLTNDIKAEPITESSTQPSKSNPFGSVSGVASIAKHSKKLGRRKLFKTLNKQKPPVTKNGILSASKSDCHVQNILDTFNSTK